LSPTAHIATSNDTQLGISSQYTVTNPLVPKVDIEKYIKDASGVWQVGRGRYNTAATSSMLL
jgi:hypothetical protein